jgi:hypothetical protein
MMDHLNLECCRVEADSELITIEVSQGPDTIIRTNRHVIPISLSSILLGETAQLICGYPEDLAGRAGSGDIRQEEIRGKL